MIIQKNKEQLQQSLRIKLAILKKQKEELLINNGYSLEDLKPKYECKLCEDTGYIRYSNRPPVMCNCLKQRILEETFENSNLVKINYENFSTFDETIYSDKSDQLRYGHSLSPRQNILNIKEKCINFINNFDEIETKNIIFHGSARLGKTFLSSCIAKELLDNGKTVLYQSAPILFDSLINEKLNKKQYETNIFDNVCNVDLLIIDDLGTEFTNTMNKTEFLNILNIRLNNNYKKPTKTIISTNYSLNDLNKTYGERFASRIIGYYDPLVFYGDDIRFVKSKSKQSKNLQQVNNGF